MKRCRDNPAVRRMAEELRQPDYRHYPAVNEAAQHHPRPHGRQLVHDVDQQQAGVRRQRPEEIVHQQYFHHRSPSGEGRISAGGLLCA
jgi:hypothetical protein